MKFRKSSAEPELDSVSEVRPRLLGYGNPWVEIWKKKFSESMQNRENLISW